MTGSAGLDARIRDAFARVTAADEQTYDDALTEAADLVAEHGRSCAALLAANGVSVPRDADPEFADRTESDLAAFWQRQFLRTFEIVDASRLMGRISDKDEVYRIWIIDHRVAARATALLGERGWDARFVSDVRSFQDEQLFSVSPATPSGTLLPAAPGLGPDPFDDAASLAGGIHRTVAVNRVAAAEAAWAETLAARDPGDVAEIDRALKMDRKEHKRALQLAAWGVRAQVLAEDERASIEDALGRWSKDDAGWPEGTPVARKAAVSEAIASLHDLFASLS